MALMAAFCFHIVLFSIHTHEVEYGHRLERHNEGSPLYDNGTLNVMATATAVLRQTAVGFQSNARVPFRSAYAHSR